MHKAEEKGVGGVGVGVCAMHMQAVRSVSFPGRG